MSTAAFIAGGQALGSVISFKGQRAMGKAQRQAAEYNRQLALNEATVLAKKKVYESEKLRQAGDKLKASQMTATAASGIIVSGNPLDLINDTYIGVEQDIAMLAYASDIEQLQKQSEADLARYNGLLAEKAANINATATLIGGVSSAGSTYKSLS